ncbi:MAG: GcrA cell cycle regulator [Rhodobacteraceae bacterium]|nr:GcrA cell cycle regulator [Paracoccaceae bacterium]
MSWTDERVETLKRMWTEGQSASQIAKELGGVTRNAVIGKVHRLGLSNRSGVGGGIGGDAEGLEAAPAPVETAVPPPVVDAAPVEVPAPPRAAPRPVAAPDAPEPVAVSNVTTLPGPSAPVPPRRPVLVPGQPLPPQPSVGEISPEALATVREVEKKARKITLMELTERTCKWPIGDPATPNFWFCGLPTQAGKPYCEAHVGVAFQPMSSRRDRRR